MTTTPPATDPTILAWGMTFLCAVVAGVIVGLLVFQQSKGSWPAALLAALGAAGATFLGVHGMLMT